VAAFAVLGTTGGAAALGVGPIAFNNGPLNHHNPVASSSSVVENSSETTTTTTAAPTVTTTVVVTTTVPTTVPAIGIDTSDPVDDSTNNDATNSSAGDNAESHSTEVVGDSGKSDSSSNSSDTSGSESNDSGSEPATEPSNDPPTSTVPASEPSHPVAGPLTKSIDEGSATVDMGPNGLVIVDITPATGVGFEVESKPDSIDIQFHDQVSGNEMSSLEFDLVEGGITVKVDHPN